MRENTKELTRVMAPICAAIWAAFAPFMASAQEADAGPDEQGDHERVFFYGQMTPETEIVVTGVAHPIHIRQLGSAVTVIDGEEIEQQGVAYLSDVLRQVPGLAVNQSGSFGSTTQVRIRGGEANHTLVLIDGVDVSAVGQGEFDFASLLTGNIAQVQVLRGPQSGFYGSNALSGVINIITKGGEGPFLSGGLEAGSYGTIMARAGLNYGDRANFLSASGQFRSTDGFSSAAIGSEDDGDRNGTIYLRGGAELSPILKLSGHLRFVDKQSETDGFDFSGGANQGLAIDDDSFSNSEEWSGGLSLEFAPSDGFSGRLNASYSAHEMQGGSGDIAFFGSKSDRFKLGAISTLEFGNGGHFYHRMSAFADYEQEGFRNSFPSDPSQIATQSRNIMGLGAEYQLDLLDALYFKGSVRHDVSSQFADETTYSLTAAWLVENTGSRFHASYGRGITNPTFSEQFGFNPGTFVGNPDLTPEKAVGYDFGIEQRIGGNVLVDVTYFNSTLEDEIASQFPTVVNDIGKSDREGIEASASIELEWLSFSGSYTYLVASDPDETREVRRPKHQASFNAYADFAQSRGNVNLGVNYNGQMLDTDFRRFFSNGFASEKSPLASYFLVRAAASYQISEQITLFGRVENLFDEQYQEVISYASTGLAAYGGVRVKFE